MIDSKLNFTFMKKVNTLTSRKGDSMDKDIDKKKIFISRRAVLKGVGTMAGLTAVSALFGFPSWWMLQGCSNEDSGSNSCGPPDCNLATCGFARILW